MSNLKEFSYTDILQRRVIYYNAFLTFLLSGYIFSDICLELVYYFFYFPVIKIIFIFLLGGLFLGNIAGRVLFSLIRAYRLVYVVVEVAFVLFCSLYILRNTILPNNGSSLLIFFNKSTYAIPLMMSVITFFAGIKINYLLKVSCGTFIDDKEGVIYLVASFLAGVFGGISISGLRFIIDSSYNWSDISVFLIALPVFILPSMILIKLPYNPEKKYAQNFAEDEETLEVENDIRDSLIFTYLNFSYAIIYIFLGMETVLKYYGATIHVKLSYITVVIIGLLIGFIIGKLIRGKLSHIYTELFFPIFFVPFVHFLSHFHQTLPFYQGIIIILPSGILFGYSLNHTITNILSKFDQKRRFAVIDFSMFILPVPILISLSYINFSYIYFFGLLYTLAFMNIIIPGISILGRKISGYKKLLYAAASLIMILSVIFSHQYFNITLSKKIYVSKMDNFDALTRTNFNAHFIKNRGAVTMNGENVFILSDSIIRNMKRALVSLAVYQSGEKDMKVLFIDGNQKFFKNPVIGYYKESVCLDIIPESRVDYKSLPVSGRIKYIPESEDLLFYMKNSDKKFDAVVDIPNILDQNRNHFRFTEAYYRKLKQKLINRRIFVQLYNINEIRKEFLSESLRNLKKVFTYHNAYLFSNVLTVLSSDSKSSLKIDRKKYDYLSEFLNSRDELKILFYNEFHILTHLLSSDIDYLLSTITDEKVHTNYFIDQPEKATIGKSFFRNYTENNMVALDIIDTSEGSKILKNSMLKKLKADDDIYTHIKKTEYAESTDNYEDETKHLFQLKKYTEYRTRFREYLNDILSYKEDYYYNAALRLEAEKKWEDAKILYMASLRINDKNFNTNYRLGLLCITLQDIDNAFKHLRNAMSIDNKHPKVLYQMGVLFFSNGQSKEAVKYLQRAISEKEESASLYLYLGLSYEKLGKLSEAKNYYSRALLLDANDDNIKDRLEKIKIKMKEERIMWKTGPMKNEMEEEQGENFPLPINKSAFEWRLSDKEAEKYKNND